MYYYSPKKNEFYPEQLKQDYLNMGVFPPDVIEVSDEVWLEFAGNLAPEGKIRIAGKNGIPIWEDVPPLSELEIIKTRRKKQEICLNEVMYHIQFWQTQLMLNMINEEDKKKLMEWVKYAQALKDIDLENSEVEFPQKPE
ncbi:tail fiber assembly protein [Proteus mirabilis]|uniref:tail fiber assembly protein n=1 Tax=Proteus mirabilis TaxID=584 RepID=UPI00157FD771|nr:tail fiber assembly protein [Proteus mirabilis]MBG2990259.1 tail fiber assembly protein [Proteus mirabilis]MBG6041064.1 tail fiber assembly protein [Proteus mirabilis]MCY9778734.1 tail fiber assembly protein [Proteus mirabilis]MCY9781794.1 tail fiber assembly protein [Proteus mirabilis]MCY9790920.1 tail fiber assembly protein [Proteus mirabilis]